MMIEEKVERVICKHCGMDTAIRNPSGYCDHLYYPENCEICKGEKKNKKPMSRDKLAYIILKQQLSVPGSSANDIADAILAEWGK